MKRPRSIAKGMDILLRLIGRGAAPPSALAGEMQAKSVRPQ
jgi:hypothetical protein